MTVGDIIHMIDELKRIRHEIWIKSEIIKQSKKEIKALQQEYETLMGYKKLEREEQKNVHTNSKIKGR